MATIPLEPARRLSESIIWSLQRGFYAREGAQAWKPQGIPFWITSNPFFARAYARVVLGFLRDLAAGSAGVALDREAPLHIVELAAGSGQFAYLFLRHMRELTKTIPALEGLRLRYVLSDFTDSNVRAWESHERFRPFLDEGALDFALFDLERDTELRLVRSGQRLAAGTLSNPLVVLANYAFDSTLQDCFRIRSGALYEDLVRASVAAGSATDPGDPTLLQRIVALDHQPQPVSGAYYGDPRLDGLLESYRLRLGDTVFLFPIGALRCLGHLLDLSQGRLLLICGDKGMSREDDLRGRGEPVMARQAGCFSFSVNLHALGRYVEQAGGRALHTADPRPRLQVSAFLGPFARRPLPETVQAFSQEIDGFGPGEFFTLASTLCEQKQPVPLEAMLAMLKLSGHDAEVLHCFRDALAQAARAATDLQKEQLRLALEAAWEGSYPLQKDLAFELARISFAMADARGAVRYCKESLRLFGEKPEVLLMLAYGHHALGEDAEAVGRARRSLELKPGFGRAQELLRQLHGSAED